MKFAGCFLLFSVVAFLSPAESFSQSGSSQNVTPSVQGTVVLSGEDSPVRHARVELFLGESASPLSALADDDGKFQFTQVSPATYRIIVSAPGCQSLYESSNLPNGVHLLFRLRKAEHSPNPRNDSVVSVQELAMPDKVERAFEKGTHYLLIGDVQASLPYFKKAIEQAPSYFRSYHNLGLAHYRLGQLDAAEQDFQQAIDLSNGGFAPSLFALSMVFYRRADFRGAESLVQRGLELAPGSGVGKYCLGLVQFSLGRIADSERSAQDAVRLDAAETDAYVLLARIHERQRNPYAVLADTEAYLKRDPNGPLHSDALEMFHRAQQDVSRLSASLD
jgi:tetratricopeptide (TPR) repeat protein